MPKTLLGRLLLVLFASTGIAQVLTLALLERESPAGRVGPAPRAVWIREIARVVGVLDVVRPEERPAVLAVFTRDAPFVASAKLEAWPDDWQTAIHEDPQIREAHRLLPENSIRADGLGEYAIKLKDGSALRIELSRNEPARPPWILWGFGVLPLLGLLLLGVFVIARQLTRPLARVASEADALGRNFRRPPMPEEGPLEVRTLARAFNLLQKRLIAYVDERNRILAAMSHDLRTPITRLRLRAERIESDEQRNDFERDLDEMHLLVESTLDLLRGVGRAEPESEQDLCGVLSELQTEFDELGWNVTSSCGRGAVVQCRRLAVKRCLRNLIENAVKYGVQARVTAELQDDEVVVLIADKGPGIPEDQLDAVFQPFYRLEHSRSRETGGLGLGLSIAREIAQFHRATLTLRNAPGGGAICELRFPSSLMQAENTA